jgi:hypothetical protein
MSILKLILGAVLRFLWDRAEKMYQRELAYRRLKKELVNEVKVIAREAADRGDSIRIERESVNDSLLRLERLVIKRRESQRIDRPVFGEAYRRPASGDRSGDSGGLSEVPSAGGGRYSGDSEAEQFGAEFMGAGSDDSLPPT